MTRRARLFRLLLVVAAVCLAAWVGRRWTTAAAISFALLALSAAWVVGTVVAVVADFYWPPKVQRTTYYVLPGDQDPELRKYR